MTGRRADRKFLAQALALAAMGEGNTSPNPQVGAVLVRDGRLVGWGYHEAAGKPHAETRAIRMAGRKARGATLYVNLEPCAHHGRTPPCADRVIESGIRTVVASLRDPNPLVNGLGFERLRQSGVQVDTGLLEQPARRLNEMFLHWHTTGRPFVTLKAASSLDGRIQAPHRESRFISGVTSRRMAHRLRLRHDAILVGAGTVRADNPSLTVRLAGRTYGRVRAVIAPDLNVDPDADVFRAGPGPTPLTRIYASTGVARHAEARFAGKAQVVRVPSASGKLDLLAVLQDLGRQGVQSVLVEGGGRTWSGFLSAGLADRVAVFLAASLFGELGVTPLIDGSAAMVAGAATQLTDASICPLGTDLLWTGRIAPATS